MKRLVIRYRVFLITILLTFIIAIININLGLKSLSIGAWSTTKIPLFLFEMSALGTKFAVTRLLIDIPGIIIIIAYILEITISKSEKIRIYKNAELLD